MIYLKDEAIKRTQRASMLKAAIASLTSLNRVSSKKEALMARGVESAVMSGVPDTKSIGFWSSLLKERPELSTPDGYFNTIVAIAYAGSKNDDDLPTEEATHRIQETIVSQGAMQSAFAQFNSACSNASNVDTDKLNAAANEAHKGFSTLNGFADTLTSLFGGVKGATTTGLFRFRDAYIGLGDTFVNISLSTAICLLSFSVGYLCYILFKPAMRWVEGSQLVTMVLGLIRGFVSFAVGQLLAKFLLYLLLVEPPLPQQPEYREERVNVEDLNLDGPHPSRCVPGTRNLGGTAIYNDLGDGVLYRMDKDTHAAVRSKLWRAAQSAKQRREPSKTVPLSESTLLEPVTEFSDTSEASTQSDTSRSSSDGEMKHNRTRSETFEEVTLPPIPSSGSETDTRYDWTSKDGSVKITSQAATDGVSALLSALVCTFLSTKSEETDPAIKFASVLKAMPPIERGFNTATAAINWLVGQLPTAISTVLVEQYGFDGIFSDNLELRSIIMQIYDLDAKITADKTVIFSPANRANIERLHRAFNDHYGLAVLSHRPGSLNGKVLSDCYKIIGTHASAVGVSKTAGRSRHTPVGLWITGKSGLGKSLMIPQIAGNVFPDTPADDRIYTRSACTDYWSGYSGAETVVFDDYEADRDEDHTQMLSFLSNAAFEINQADISQKGTFIAPRLTIVSSNSAVDIKRQDITNNDAFINRFRGVNGVTIHVTARKRFVGADGKGLNINLVKQQTPANLANFAHLKFHVSTRLPTGKTVKAFYPWATVIQLLRLKVAASALRHAASADQEVNVVPSTEASEEQILRPHVRIRGQMDQSDTSVEAQKGWLCGTNRQRKKKNRKQSAKRRAEYMKRKESRFKSQGDPKHKRTYASATHTDTVEEKTEVASSSGGEFSRVLDQAEEEDDMELPPIIPVGGKLSANLMEQVQGTASDFSVTFDYLGSLIFTGKQRLRALETLMRLHNMDLDAGELLVAASPEGKFDVELIQDIFPHVRFEPLADKTAARTNYGQNIHNFIVNPQRWLPYLKGTALVSLVGFIIYKLTAGSGDETAPLLSDAIAQGVGVHAQYTTTPKVRRHGRRYKAKTGEHRQRRFTRGHTSWQDGQRAAHKVVYLNKSQGKIEEGIDSLKIDPNVALKINSATATLSRVGGRMRAFFVGGQTILINRHFFLDKSGDLLKKGYKFVVGLRDRDDLHFKFDPQRLIAMASEVRGMHTDVAFYDLGNNIKGLQAFPSLGKFFTKSHDVETDYVKDMMSLSFDWTGGDTTLNHLGHAHRLKKPVSWSSMGAPKEDIYLTERFMYDPILTDGDCGSILLTVSGGEVQIHGIHAAQRSVGGVPSEGIGVRVDADDIACALEEFATTTSHIGPCELHPAIQPFGGATRDMPEGNFTMAGRVKAPYMGGKESALKPSPFGKHLGLDVPYQVPVTDPNDPRWISSKVPGRNGLLVRAAGKNATTRNEFIDEDHLDDLSADIVNDNIALKPSGVVRKLTMDEAINGDPFARSFSHLGRLSMDTSGGYYASLDKPAGSKGKRHCFTNLADESEELARYVLSNERVLQQVEQAEDCLKAGRVFPTIWKVFLKDELRPDRKIPVGDTRHVTVCPLTMTLLFRQYFGAYISNFYSQNTRTYSAVGMNPYSMDWDAMIHRLCDVSRGGFGGDFSKFSSRITSKDAERWAKGVNAWYRAHAEPGTPESILFEECRARQILAYMCIVRIELIGSTCYQVYTSMGDGNPATVTMNTQINYLWLALAFYSIMKRANQAGSPPMYRYQDFIRCLSIVIYGDDNMIAVLPEVNQWFNGVAVQDWFAEANITYTPPDKEGVMVPIVNMLDLSFLGNTTIRGDLISGIEFYPYVSQAGVDKSLAFFRDSKHLDDNVLLGQCVGSALHRLYPSQDGRFELLHRQAMEWSHSVGMPMILPSLGDMKSRWTTCNFEEFDQYHVIRESISSQMDVLDVFDTSPRLTPEQDLLIAYEVDGLMDVYGHTPHWEELSYLVADYALSETVAEADRNMAAILDQMVSIFERLREEDDSDDVVIKSQMDTGIILDDANPTMPSTSNNAEETKSADATGALDEKLYSFTTLAERPQYITSFPWNITEVQGDELFSARLPQDIILGQLGVPFSRFEYYRGTLVISFRVNGTPFHSGALIAYFVPLCPDTLIDEWQTTSRASQSMLNNVVMMASTTSTGTLRIPFCHYRKFLSTSGSLDQGGLRVAVWNPLGTGVDNVGELDVTIFAQIEDAEFKILKPNGLLSSNPAIARSGDTVRIRSQGQTYSYVRNANIDHVQTESMSVTGGSDSLGDQGISSSATATLDLPNVGINPPPLVRRSPYLSNSTSVTYAQRMALSPGGDAPAAPSDFATHSDEMSIAELTQIPCWAETGRWDESDNSGTVLMNGEICPAPQLIDASIGDVIDMANLGRVASKFHFWTGGIRMTFQFVIAGSMTGRVAFVTAFGENVPPPLTVVDAMNQYAVVFDVSAEKSTFTVDIPFRYYASKARVPNGNGRTRCSTGKWSLIILNGLRAPSTTARDVAINRYVSGCEDFELEFYGGHNDTLTSGGFIPISVPGVMIQSHMMATPLDEPENLGDVSEEKEAVVAPGAASTSIPRPVEKKVTTVRDLISRASIQYKELTDAAVSKSLPTSSMLTMYQTDGTRITHAAWWAASYRLWRGPVTYMIYSATGIITTFRPDADADQSPIDNLFYNNAQLGPSNAAPFQNSVDDVNMVAVTCPHVSQFEALIIPKVPSEIYAASSNTGALSFQTRVPNIVHQAESEVSVFVRPGDNMRLGVFIGVPPVVVGDTPVGSDGYSNPNAAVPVGEFIHLTSDGGAPFMTAESFPVEYFQTNSVTTTGNGAIISTMVLEAVTLTVDQLISLGYSILPNQNVEIQYGQTDQRGALFYEHHGVPAVLNVLYDSQDSIIRGNYDVIGNLIDEQDLEGWYVGTAMEYTNSSHGNAAFMSEYFGISTGVPVSLSGTSGTLRTDLLTTTVASVQVGIVRPSPNQTALWDINP